MLVVLVVGLLGRPVSAGPEGLGIPFIPQQRDRHERSGMDLDEAVRRIQQRTQGRVLSADVVGDGGRPNYRIKVLLPNGRVRVFYVDAGG